MQVWDVVVLGGGIAGLSMAHALGKRGKRVLVLEKNDTPGGALQSATINSFSIDKYYHHIFPFEWRSIALCKELRVPIEWKYATTAFFANGRSYRLTKPQDLLTFGYLSWNQRFALARMMYALRKISLSNIPRYDDVSARGFVEKHGGTSLYARFFAPLLRAKFGKDAERTSAAWLISRTKMRGNRNLFGEKLGYVRGGFSALTDALVRALELQGNAIECCAGVRSLRKHGALWQVDYGKARVAANAVVSTLPPAVLMRLVRLPESYRAVLRRLEYQGSCCVLVGLDKPLTRHYWTNIMQPASFGAVIEHTNFQNKNEYCNEHVAYLASYHDLADPVWAMTDEQVATSRIADMHRLFRKRNVNWWRVYRLPAAGLIYRTGTLKDMLPVTTPLPGLFAAGQFNLYPERGIHHSLSNVEKIVHAVCNAPQRF